MVSEKWRQNIVNKALITHEAKLQKNAMVPRDALGEKMTCWRRPAKKNMFPAIHFGVYFTLKNSPVYNDSYCKACAKAPYCTFVCNEDDFLINSL